MRIILLQLCVCLMLVACGSGGENGGEGETVYPPEYIQDVNGNIVGYSFKSDDTGFHELGTPPTLQYDFEFSKPVRLENNLLVTLEPSTRITMKEDPLLTDLGVGYFRVSIDVWNKSGEDYPGAFYDPEIRNDELWYPDRALRPTQLFLSAFNQNMSNGWFTRFEWFFTDINRRLDSVQEVVEIRNSGVHFEPSKVTIAEYSEGVRLGDRGTDRRFNLAAQFYRGTQIEEVFDRSLLVENSPWYSFVRDSSGTRCGSTYRFFDDGMLIIERESDGLIGTGTYQFDETGTMSWDTDAFGQTNVRIITLNPTEWSVALLDMSSENGAIGSFTDEFATPSRSGGQFSSSALSCDF